MRTIEAPGVEINEIDLSQYNPGMVGTASLVVGFANKGEDYMPLEFSSRNSWLTYFGKPIDEAERYFYNASLDIINQGGKLYCAKLPYNNDSKDIYFSSTYSVSTSGVSLSSSALSAITNDDPTLINYFEISTDDSTVQIALSALDKYRTGLANPSAGNFEIIDITRSKLSTDKNDREVVGIFPVVTTAVNALAIQKMIDVADGNITDYMSISSAETSAGLYILSANTTIPFITEDSITDLSLSRLVAETFPTITYDDEGKFDRDNLRKIGIVVVKAYKDTAYGNKINFSLLEAFSGSLNKAALDPSTGESTYIGSLINGSSNYIELYSNISTASLPDVNSIYYINKQNSNIFGFSEDQTAKTISLSGITQGLNTIYDKLSNIDETEIDIIIDAGISNIAQAISNYDDNEGVYDPESSSLSGWTITDNDSLTEWKSIIGMYINFCANTRKDCMFIADSPRPLVLEGNQKIVRTSAPNNTVDVNIINKFKYLTGINTSYGAGYSNWFKQLDEFTGLNFWCPPSIKAAAIYVYNDRVANIWDAPAGLNRGIVYGVNDITFNPNKKQAGSIYTKAWNFAVNYPYDGIVLEGQKTFQVKPSAFDRVNVRRMFLRLERQVYKIARYYVYEPNNEYTRTRFVDQITPIFDDVKLRGGLYDYRIVCNQQNNTEEVIDRNELKVSIMIKPTKTAEFLILNFVALRTGGSFSEVIL